MLRAHLGTRLRAHGLLGKVYAEEEDGSGLQLQLRHPATVPIAEALMQAAIRSPFPLRAGSGRVQPRATIKWERLLRGTRCGARPSPPRPAHLTPREQLQGCCDEQSSETGPATFRTPEGVSCYEGA